LRKSKVSVRDFARAPAADPSFTQFLNSLPDILAAGDLRRILAAIHYARSKHKAILWGIGGHVIKVGLGPVLIDLMGRGFVSGIAMNGAALIHDFEIALAGNTSEDALEWPLKPASTSTKFPSWPRARVSVTGKRRASF
jgi:deoxyhypusine synthase